MAEVRITYDIFGNREETTYVGDKKHGVFRMYRHEKLRVQCEYVDGKIEGIWRMWYDGVNLWKEFCYVNGKKEGLARTWHRNGQPNKEYYHVNDKVEGVVLVLN